MYNFENISALYEFSTCVTFPDGCESTFRKVEHIEAKKVKSGFSFTFTGCGDETFDGKEPEAMDATCLELGKALYPYTLLVNEDGKLIGVRDFEKLKESWIARRDAIIEKNNCNVEVKKTANSYSQYLKTERMFLSVWRRSLFFRLLFWQDDQKNKEVEIGDFPYANNLSIFILPEGTEKDSSLCYQTDRVYDDGLSDLLSGKCTMDFSRDSDGLPSLVSLSAMVEKKSRGSFTKEITVRRL